MLPNENLAEFYAGRRDKLMQITRYHGFDTMFYRTNDWIHSLRVRWIVEELLPIAKKHFKKFDAERAIVLALVHDDAEVLTGDVQAGHKAVMSRPALLKVENNERRAIALLGKKYPVKIDSKYAYGNLLLEIFEKKTLEAQFVSYADKMDGYCESLHELYAGNFSFLRSVIFYTNVFARADKKFPKLKPMLGDQRSPFTDLQSYLQEHFVVAKKYADFGKPFTKQSLKKLSQFPFYNRWREVTLERGGNEGLETLFKQAEFLQ